MTMTATWHDRWPTSIARGVLGILALAGGGIILMALLELVGFAPDQSLVLAAAAMPVLAVAYLLIATIRRRWRFSLKTLLLFYVLAGFGLTFFVSQRNSLRDREEAVNHLLGLQARLTYAEPRAPTWLQDLVGREYFESGPVVEVLLVPPKTKFIMDAALAPLSNLRSLRALEVFGPKITDAGLKVLRDLPQLEVVSLSGVPVSDEGLKHVAHLSNLKDLHLDSTRITDIGVEHLAGFKNLEHLTLDGSRITDDGLSRLAHLKNLRVLSLNDTLVTAEGVARLRKQLPQTEIRHENIIPREQRAAVEHIRQLGGIFRRDNKTGKFTTVDLAANQGNEVEDKHLAALVDLPDLEVAELGNNPRITDKGLESLSKLTKVKTLYLYFTGVRGPGLAHLAGMPELRFLSLQGTPVTDEAIVYLQELESLESLNLMRTSISAAAIRKLQAALPKCEIVH